MKSKCDKNVKNKSKDITKQQHLQGQKESASVFRNSKNNGYLEVLLKFKTNPSGRVTNNSATFTIV